MLIYKVLLLLVIINKISSQIRPPRQKTLNIVDFGGVGDGKTLNTNAFETAIEFILDIYPNSTLYIPQGEFLTGPFNLTSHMTLFLESGASIVGVQDSTQWPIIPFLPSYGRGRDHDGPRFTSLIHADTLVDVAIAGNNGTINGNGQYWWQIHESGKEIYTRGHLLEFLSCLDIFLENITLINSPFWTIHPWNSNGFYANLITIINPLDSPNTDGIDPDSSSNVFIQNSFYTGGDDAISVKSGWDCFGLDFNVSSTNIFIRNYSVYGGHGGVAIGSEVSGGISNVYVTDSDWIESESAPIKIKTNQGRGAFIKNITYNNLKIIRKEKQSSTENIDFTANYGSRNPQCGSKNESALTIISDIYISNVYYESNMLPAATMSGDPNQPITDIQLENLIMILSSNDTSKAYSCENISGYYKDTIPQPCSQLIPQRKTQNFQFEEN